MAKKKEVKTSVKAKKIPAPKKIVKKPVAKTKKAKQPVAKNKQLAVVNDGMPAATHIPEVQHPELQALHNPMQPAPQQQPATNTTPAEHKSSEPNPESHVQLKGTSNQVYKKWWFIAIVMVVLALIAFFIFMYLFNRIVGTV